mgnify:CR=1 FL=1
MISSIATWILKIFGWKIDVDLPNLKKFVVIAAPHTSNWDFPLGILTVKALKLDVTWMGKHSLFRWPFGWFFRAIGGTPVRRDKAYNYIAQMTDLFEKSDELILALAPEGTRSKTDHWKTGFHYIARAANVPILMGYFDYANKVIGIHDLLYPGDDIEADFEKIRKLYGNWEGKNPEKAGDIRVRQKTSHKH